MCLSAGCGLVGVKDSVCQQHSTPYHQCVIIPLQALSACSVIFPLSGIASASICSFTHHTFYIWMERGITTAAGLAGGKSASQAPKGNRHTYCGCAALCCAIWWIETDVWEIGTPACSEDWRRKLTLSLQMFLPVWEITYAGTKWTRKQRELTSTEQCP